MFCSTFSISRAQSRTCSGYAEARKRREKISTFNRKKLCANIRFHQSFSALGIRCRQPVPEPVGSICRWRRVICLRKYGRRSASRNAVSQRRRNRVSRRGSKTRRRIFRVGTMRRFYLVAILLAAVGCERIEPDEAQSPRRPSEETPALMKVHARVDEPRTSLGGPRDTEVRWTAGAAIARWGGDSPACRR